MTGIMRSLREDHDNHFKLLAVIGHEIDAMERGGSANCDLLEAALAYCLSYQSMYHHPREDQVFRMLRDCDRGVAEDIGDLQTEHEDLNALTRAFAEAVHAVSQGDEQPPDRMLPVAREFLDFYQRHMRMEEERFFPAALRTLTAVHWAEIESKSDVRGDPLFGAHIEHRYAELRHAIMHLGGSTRGRCPAAPPQEAPEVGLDDGAQPLPRVHGRSSGR
ncbi:MAG: hemerythrin domain-containing protein [Alphaproteobacteria bacterium]